MPQSTAGRRSALLPTERVPSSRRAAESRWRRNERVLWRFVLDDVVVLPDEEGREPFAVAGGRRIWEAVSEERGLDELAHLLGATGSESDLALLLDSLTESGVLDRTSG